MNRSEFLNLVSQFREVYFAKTFGEVVMLVAQGNPQLAAKANEAVNTDLDCSKDNTRIWAFLKHLNLN